MITRSMRKVFKLLSKGYKLKAIICSKPKNIRCICQPFPSKTELGIKFWCFNCRRFVLPDKNHYAELLSYEDVKAMQSTFLETKITG